MGLEKKVDKVLVDYHFNMPVEYRWENGLIVDDMDDAYEIMRALDDSQQFAPTFYNYAKKEIVFGNITDGNHLKAFKNHVRSMTDKRQQDLLIALVNDVFDDFFDNDDARIESMKESISNISDVCFCEDIL